jgi:hypothetical protein
MTARNRKPDRKYLPRQPPDPMRAAAIARKRAAWRPQGDVTQTAKQFYMSIDIAHEFHLQPAPGSIGEGAATKRP